MQTSLPRPPSGFRFVPKEEELIKYYLYNKVHARLHGEDSTFIKDYNLYGEEEPWEIYIKFQGHKSCDDGLYFFTTLHKKTTNGTKKMNRSVGTHGGTWHGDGGNEVESSEGIVIGTKKRFRYHKHGKPVKDGWILLEYGSESVSKNIVIPQLKKSERGSSKKESTSTKRKHVNAEVFEVDEDDDILKIIQSAVINSKPVRSPDLGAQQIFYNQDMWREAATVSLEDDGGRSAEVTCDNILMMELGASAIVNSGPDLSRAQEPQQITANQEIWLEAATVALENDGGFSNEYTFDDEISFFNGEPVLLRLESDLVNFTQEPMINEHQQMALACFRGNHEERPVSVEDYELTALLKINEAAINNCEKRPMKFNRDGSCKLQLMAMRGFNFPVTAVCDNMTSSDNAVPEVRAVPSWILASSSMHLKNETNWFANFQALQMEECDEDDQVDELMAMKSGPVS